MTLGGAYALLFVLLSQFLSYLLHVTRFVFILYFTLHALCSALFALCYVFMHQVRSVEMNTSLHLSRTACYI